MRSMLLMSPSVCLEGRGDLVDEARGRRIGDEAADQFGGDEAGGGGMGDQQFQELVEILLDGLTGR